MNVISVLSRKSAKKYAILIVFLLLALIPVMTQQDRYIMFTASGVCIWAVMTIALYINLNTGIYNFAPAAFMGIGAYTTALMITKWDISFWATIPVSMINAIVVAILLGLPILRIKGIYFILVTALFSQVVLLFIASLSGFTGGWGGVSNIPKPKLFFIDFSSQTSFYYLTLIFLAIAFVFAYRLWYSQIGKIYRHISSNDTLAQSVGVSLVTYKIQSFAIAGALFGLSGSVFAVHIRYINPGIFDLFASLEPWFYLVIGGATSIFGPFIGTSVVKAIRELFSFEPMLSPIIVGFIMILIVLFLPMGVASLPSKVKQFVTRKRS